MFFLYGIVLGVFLLTCGEINEGHKYDKIEEIQEHESRCYVNDIYVPN